MSGHWQMKKPMWAIEITDGPKEGQLYADRFSDGEPVLFRMRKSAMDSGTLKFAHGRIVKVRVHYTEITTGAGISEHTSDG